MQTGTAQTDDRWYIKKYVKKLHIILTRILQLLTEMCVACRIILKFSFIVKRQCACKLYTYFTRFCEAVFVTNKLGFSHKLLPYLLTNQTLNCYIGIG